MDFLAERMTRQGLAARSMATTPGVATAAAGLQAQDPGAARLGVRARSGAVDEASVLDAVRTERSAVRTWLMRSTVHLVAAGDVRWMTTLLGPRLERSHRARWRQLGITEPLIESALPHVRELLDGRGLTRHEIAAELAVRGIRLAEDGQAATHLGYRDRTAMIEVALQQRVYVGGIIKATVVCDGRVIGMWRLDRSARSATIRVTPFEPFTRRHRDELDRERADIERFLGRPVALEVEPELLASGACVRSSTQKRARPVS
jgi:Winged helix DNA-binding domain